MSDNFWQEKIKNHVLTKVFFLINTSKIEYLSIYILFKNDASYFKLNVHLFEYTLFTVNKFLEV